MPDAARAGRPLPAPPGQAVAIIRSDETLLASYLLNVGASPDASDLTDEHEAQRFLLWFALDGWRQHQQVMFSPAYLAFLADPAPPYASRLAAQVLLRRKDVRMRLGLAAEAFHAWYYIFGVNEMRLAPLISARERHALHQPVDAAELDGLTRLALHLHRADAEVAAAHDLGTEARRQAYADWFAAEWLPEAAPWQRVQPMAGHRRGDAVLAVNLFGFADGVLGIGEDLRTMGLSLLRAGAHVAIHDIALPADIGSTARHGWHTLFSDRPIFGASLFCLPPFEMKRLKIRQGSHLFAGRRNIGVWPWELPSLPPDWASVFDDVDEVWALSRFLAETWRGLSERPLRLMPPHVALPEPITPEVAERWRGARFVALAMCDFNSFMARKNPEGAIAAFRTAFPDRAGGERLVLKTLNGAAHPAALHRLREMIGDDPRIILIDRSLPRREALGLIASADCFLSLHRAEGFGRVMAEAMALGVPVVGTGWSGSDDFLDDSTGWPVSYDLRPLSRRDYVYSAGSVWAEPEIGSAGQALRAIAAGKDGPVVAGRKAAARRRIEALCGLDVCAARVRAALVD